MSSVFWFIAIVVLVMMFWRHLLLAVFFFCTFLWAAFLVGVGLLMVCIGAVISAFERKA